MAAASRDASAPHEAVVPALHFRNWRAGDGAEETLASITTITQLTGVPAISSDGTLALVRFDYVELCQVPDILILDVKTSARKHRWPVPVTSCNNDIGMPVTKNGVTGPSPKWSDWETTFAAATRDKTWEAMERAVVEIPSNETQRWVAHGIRITIDTSDKKRTMARTHDNRTSELLAEVDLRRAHAGLNEQPVVLAEAFVHPARRVVAARFVAVQLSDHDSFPTMDHVLAPKQK